jgi:hypothetical protein
MRQRIEQKKKADGPLGIRTGVWLTVFGLVLVCLLTISLSQRHSSRPTTETPLENVAGQDSSNRPRVSVQRTPNIKFTPKDYESGSDNEDALWSMAEQMAQDRRTWVDGPE